MSDDRQKKPICKTLSAAAFAIIWLAVCTVTSVAALKLPLNKLIGWEKVQPNDKIDNDLTINSDSSNRPSIHKYWGHVFKDELGKVPKLYDGEVLYDQHYAGDNHSVGSQITVPLDHLISFMTTGDVNELLKAVHPKLAEYFSDRYGSVIAVLSGNRMLTQRLAGKLIGSETNMEGKDIIRIEYEILSVKECGENELNRIANEAEHWTENELNLCAASKIALRFTAHNEAGMEHFDGELLLFQTNEGWFVDVGSAFQNIL